VLARKKEEEKEERHSGEDPSPTLKATN